MTERSHDAAVAWAEAYDGMWDMAERFHASLTFTEASALADVLDAAGRGDLAATLIHQWAAHDPEAANEFEVEHPGFLAALIERYGTPLST